MNPSPAASGAGMKGSSSRGSLFSWAPRSTRAFALHLLAGAVILLGNGCATTPSEPPLEVRLVDLRFGQATVFETTATVTMRVENLSPEPIRVTGASHKLTVNGLRLGRAQGSVSLPIERLASGTHELEVHLGNVALARTVESIQRTRALQYELSGTVYYEDARGRARSVRVDRSGQVDEQNFRSPGSTVPAAPRP